MRTLRRWQAISAMALAALLLGIVLVLAGCGSSSEGSTASTSSSPAGTTMSVAGFQVTSDPALTALLPSEVKDRGEIRVGSNMPYPPWEMYVSEGSSQPTGIDYDLSQAMAAKLGMKSSFNQTAFDALIPSLAANKSDIVMAAMDDTKEREQTVSFVDYAYDSTGILVPKGNPLAIQGTSDLSGKRIGHQSGTTTSLQKKIQAELKASGKPLMEVQDYPGFSDCLLALKSGKIDAIMANMSYLNWVAKQSPNDYEVVQDPANPHGYDPVIFGAAVSKTNTALLDAWQKALQGLIDDGTYAKIMDKYGAGNEAVDSAQVNQGK